jgi:hypothetical protein
VPVEIFGNVRPIEIPTPRIILPRTTTLTQKHNTGALTLGFDAAIDFDEPILDRARNPRARVFHAGQRAWHLFDSARHRRAL